MRSARPIRSGTWLVVGMFGFGLLLIAGLYSYWTLHVGPFRALTSSLEERYPGSVPRVEGGKLRLDQPGERILRIVMQPSFDPADEAKANHFASEVAQFAMERQSPGLYDVVEIHLFTGETEGDLSQRTVRLTVEEIAAAADNGASPGE